ncbi:MAG: transglycosylase domain-containing protein [Bdellovibrionaceae bacterium]|nr:transglycosylase domain-containing protein [Bdellovibrionales bacterium]MCB9085317.1 transglycosylase domain-containing protein [Pseudobdellovibrionaceae bacterium]
MSFDRTKTIIAFTAFPALSLLLLGIGFSLVVLTLPDVKQLKSCMTTTMNRVELCTKKETYVPLNKISPYLIDAVIVSEDASFRQHDGFDWFEIRQSFSTNLKRGKLARGGSTITQQLAKNAFLDGSKSLLRKVREALLTREIESLLTKDEILERYLNVVELGPNIFGVKKAASYYFNKSPADLNILESAYIAFLLPNPSVHHTYFEKKALTEYARQRVLGICLRLFRFGKIEKDDLEIANFRVLEFPWEGLSWTRTELMDAVDELLIDEAGSSDSSFPAFEQDLPESDPDLPTLGQPGRDDDGPWDSIPDQEQIDDAGGEPSDEDADTLPQEESAPNQSDDGLEPEAHIDPEPTEE